jgi:hypothetical protein
MVAARLRVARLDRRSPGGSYQLRPETEGHGGAGGRIRARDSHGELVEVPRQRDGPVEVAPDVALDLREHRRRQASSPMWS